MRTQKDANAVLWSGMGWGAAVNVLATFGVLAYGMLMTLGISQMEDDAKIRQALDTANIMCVAVPILANLPGLAYAIFTRSKRFLAGWGLGILAALLLIGLTLGCVFLYVAILQNT